MDLKCEKCGMNLGMMEKGKIRNGSVLLCKLCWGKAKAAMSVAEMASGDMPDFLKGLFPNKR